MKVFAFIMAFMVLGLSVLPCTDGSCATITKTGKIISCEKSSAQHSDDKDACSPFCQCSCCAGSSINYTATTIAAFPNVSNNKYLSFLPETMIGTIKAVWQPPKR